MDSTPYMNITEYKTDLELKFHCARNNERILCSCGKMIVKGGKWAHWKGVKHRMDTEHILLSKDTLISLPSEE